MAKKSKISKKVEKKLINKTKEKFDASTATTTTIPLTKQQGNSLADIIDLISVSPSAGDKPITFQDQLVDYGILFMKYSFLVVVLALNFLGLSVSLNCNADQELSIRIFSAIFAFFFGFVYLIINYYTYKVIGQGKICKMDRDKLFPFKV